MTYANNVNESAYIDSCKPIPTSGQREKDVWNDGFAHGWRAGFDSAHDLLEALEGLKLILLQWHEDLPDHVGDKEGAYLAKASAAIAKARNAAPFTPAGRGMMRVTFKGCEWDLVKGNGSCGRCDVLKNQGNACSVADRPPCTGGDGKNILRAVQPSHGGAAT